MITETLNAESNVIPPSLTAVTINPGIVLAVIPRVGELIESIAF